MSSDYATLFIACVMGYEVRNSLRLGEGRVALARTIWLALSLVVVFLVPQFPLVGMRVAWLASGIFLIWHGAHNFFSKQHRALQFLPVLLDAAGSWMALMLAGASATPLISGAVAGMLLPVALGPWPSSAGRWLRPVESLMMCTVGSRAIMLGIMGTTADRWPILLFTIPGLMVWEISGVETRPRVPIQ